MMLRLLAKELISIDR
jgi:ribosomal protein S6